MRDLFMKKYMTIAERMAWYKKVFLVFRGDPH